MVASQAGTPTPTRPSDHPDVHGDRRAAQTISFAPLPGKSVTDPPFAVAATASSGLVVTFTTTTPLGVHIRRRQRGDDRTRSSSGTCTVEADQPGNASFAAADAAFQSFTVTKVDQTITFAPLADHSLAQSPVAADRDRVVGTCR